MQCYNVKKEKQWEFSTVIQRDNSATDVVKQRQNNELVTQVATVAPQKKRKGDDKPNA